MAHFQTVAPTVLAVTVDQAKDALRIDGSDLDALVTNWLKGIIATLEHEIGQCIMSQTWTTTLDTFPTVNCTSLCRAERWTASAAIELPRPVRTVSSVAYVDENGVAQTLDASDYNLHKGRYSSTITPKAGTSWPSTFDDVGVVTVTTVCGYGTTATDTPDNIRLYVLGKLVEQFDPDTRSMRTDSVQSRYLDRLLDACRSYA